MAENGVLILCYLGERGVNRAVNTPRNPLLSTHISSMNLQLSNNENPKQKPLPEEKLGNSFEGELGNPLKELGAPMAEYRSVTTQAFQHA
jgi:hypothetical protein